MDLEFLPVPHYASRQSHVVVLPPPPLPRLQAYGMRLSLAQAGTTVTFTAELDTDAASPPAPDARAASATSLPAFPPGLRIYCIDDSAPARRLLEHSLKTRAQTRSVFAFGRHEVDADLFLSAALADGDIAILDQHLEFGGEANILGTDLVARLVAGGFRGLICMRSGNVAAGDRAQYHAAGAHCVFGKDAGMAQVAEQLKAAYVRHVALAAGPGSDVVVTDLTDTYVVGPAGPAAVYTP